MSITKHICKKVEIVDLRASEFWGFVFTADLSGLLSVQRLFCSCIINAQELCGSSHSIDIEMLPLRSFFIHEAECGIFRISVNKNHGDDLK